MSDEKDNPTDPVAAGSVLAEKASNPAEKAEEVAPPSLAIYFSGKRTPPGALVNAVKKAKVSRFSAEDERLAIEALAANDADGGRLWALLSQPKLPDAIDRWIWQATQERLRARIGESFDLTHATTSQLFAAVRESVAADLLSPEKEKQKAATAWLRLGTLWLIVKRSLDPWLAIEEATDLLFKKGDARRIASRSIQRGKWPEFRQAAALAGMARVTVDAARRERDEERRLAIGLQRQLSEAKAGIEALRSKVSTLEQESTATARALEETKSQWEADRVRRAHDLTETRASYKVLLGGRIAPLLATAVDALEVEPAVPDVALRRLKEALSIIAEKTQ